MDFPYGRYANERYLACSYRKTTTEELSDLMAY